MRGGGGGELEVAGARAQSGVPQIGAKDCAMRCIIRVISMNYAIRFASSLAGTKKKHEQKKREPPLANAPLGHVKKCGSKRKKACNSKSAWAGKEGGQRA